ncbi:MAG: hypothetical protein ACT4NP_17775, partial [Pseudonocardiales bacterium]
MQAKHALVGASVARHLGHADLAVQTACRGYDAARQLDDLAGLRPIPTRRVPSLACPGVLSVNSTRPTFPVLPHVRLVEFT